MAFVKVTKNREGKKYISVVEGYRIGNKVKQRTLESLGKLELLEADNPNFLEELREKVKNGSYQSSAESISVTFELNAPITDPLQNYGWKLLEGIYDILKISRPIQVYKKRSGSHFNLDKILKLLVFGRILNPQSKLKTVEEQSRIFDNHDIKLHDVYRGLDALDELSEAIQLNLHKAITESIGREAALVFYDVTNYYFETDLDDEASVGEGGEEVLALRKRGASKEKRPNPIVQMGLFMDTKGIPIAYKLFPGNCVDVKTYLPAIEQVKQQFGIKRIVVVADKGLNSKTNISATLKAEDGYLFSQKFRGKKGAPKDIQAFILDNEDWVMNPKETFAMKSFIRTRMVNKMEIKEKVVATWNQAYDIREKLRREKAVEYAEKLTASERFRMTMRKGGKRYLNAKALDQETGEILDSDFHITLDEEQMDYDAQFDGINVLITSELHLSDEEILNNYRSLSRIEDCFRVMKTEFNARPVYVWTPSRINGHFLICFLSLCIIRVLELKLENKYSPRKLVEALNSAKCRPLNNDYWEVFGSETFLEINKSLGVSWESHVVSVEKLRGYGKGIRVQHNISV